MVLFLIDSITFNSIVITHMIMNFAANGLYTAFNSIVITLICTRSENPPDWCKTFNSIVITLRIYKRAMSEAEVTFNSIVITQRATTIG